MSNLNSSDLTTAPRMKVTPIEGGAIFVLETGDAITVRFAQSALGMEGYAISINGNNSKILIEPSASNAIHVSTPKALAALDAKIKAIVAERKPKC